MASKGQKFNKYSDEQRIKIMNEYLSGNYSSSMLSTKYNIPLSSKWKRRVCKSCYKFVIVHFICIFNLRI